MSCSDSSSARLPDASGHWIPWLRGRVLVVLVVVGGGVVFAGWVMVRICKGPLLRLALLYFDSLGFDGSGACWFGLSCGGEGLLKFAGHAPRWCLALAHCLAHFSKGFILHREKKQRQLSHPVHVRNLIIHYFDLFIHL